MFHPSVIIASANPDAISAIASNPSDHSSVMAKEIPLTKGFVALVDEADYEALSQYFWQAHVIGRSIYAERTEHILLRPTVQGKRHFSMHRVVSCAPKGAIVDHINGNGLDNRRANLRLCSRAQNTYNMAPRNLNARFKGIYRSYNKWYARIMVGGQWFRLGSYATDVEAATAYDAGARKYFGEFAWLNFPDGRPHAG